MIDATPCESKKIGTASRVSGPFGGDGGFWLESRQAIALCRLIASLIASGLRPFPLPAAAPLVVWPGVPNGTSLSVRKVVVACRDLRPNSYSLAALAAPVYPEGLVQFSA